MGHDQCKNAFQRLLLHNAEQMACPKLKEQPLGDLITTELGDLLQKIEQLRSLVQLALQLEPSYVVLYKNED
jgi:hypothetical protein